MARSSLGAKTTDLTTGRRQLCTKSEVSLSMSRNVALASRPQSSSITGEEHHGRGARSVEQGRRRATRAKFTTVAYDARGWGESEKSAAMICSTTSFPRWHRRRPRTPLLRPSAAISAGKCWKPPAMCGWRRSAARLRRLDAIATQPVQ